MRNFRCAGSDAIPIVRTGTNEALCPVCNGLFPLLKGRVVEHVIYDELVTKDAWEYFYG